MIGKEDTFLVELALFVCLFDVVLRSLLLLLGHFESYRIGECIVDFIARNHSEVGHNSLRLRKCLQSTLELKEYVSFYKAMIMLYL